MRMELSLEVKGYLADIISRESMGRIENIGMMVGVESQKIREFISNMRPMYLMGGETCDPYYNGMELEEIAAQYIIENTDNQDTLVKTVLDMAKREKMGGKWYNKIYAELNSIMERTMQCRMDEEWNIYPIFDEDLQLSEKLTFIEKKLEEHKFNTTLILYKDALKTYKTSHKGSIALLRSAFDSLVDEIIESKGEVLKNNQKEKLEQLENLGILKEIDSRECQKCHYKKRDSEFIYSYSIYGLLSHYGNHKKLLTDEEEVANFLYTSALALIWLLINRYEK